MSARSRGGRGHLLGVVDRLADAHVQHDLVDLRHLQRVLVAELLDELGDDLVLVELLAAARHSPSAQPATAPAAATSRRRPCEPCPSRLRFGGRLRLAALGSGLVGLAGLRPWRCALAALVALPQPSITSPERLATRTLRPSSRILKPDARRLAVLGIGDRQIGQVDRRLLGDDAALGLRASGACGA